ncbi:MAG: hypothetical protein ACI4UY_07360, partial [Kiritimatiellia bacterium]
MLQFGEVSYDATKQFSIYPNQELRIQLSPCRSKKVGVFVMNLCLIDPLLATANRRHLRIRRIDVDDEPLAAFGVVDDLA